VVVALQLPIPGPVIGEAGAFSGLAMGLCGLVTAALFPLGVWLVRALQ
jgi:putative effector of murein hydrolase